MCHRASLATLVLVSGITVCALASVAQAQEWVTYSNETSIRMPTGPGLNDPEFSTADVEEKDYAWDDVDHDGDIDLVVVRKQPFTTPGRRRNVLFMNEGILDGHQINGVLVDRTALYIPGFLDLTADRDVVLTDVDGDTWVDIVTAPTYGEGQPDTISHPRVYMNLGDNPPGSGNWQGFAYDPARIPVWPTAPNFCGVSAGDVTGDLKPDLYFTDYDAGGFNNTYDDRLLINDGTGHFDDETDLRMSSAMTTSGFGINNVIADTNHDGWNDVLKNEAGPVKTMHNAGDGFFDTMETTYLGAAYFFNVGYINDDDLLDIVISDDSVDRYMLNIGNGANGFADFDVNLLPQSTSGFGSNSLVVDLNLDGYNDIIIADVDVDAQGCSRVSDILRNSGPPNWTFTADSGGISSSMLSGVHDVAVFDVNGDTFPDLVLGRCNGTQIWINAPPVSLVFEYPAGLPEMADPAGTTQIEVSLTAFGDTLDPKSPMLHVSIDEGEFMSIPMIDAGENIYVATLPEAECLAHYSFYVSASLNGGLEFTDPVGAPAANYQAIAAHGTTVVLTDSIEGDVSDWSIESDPSLEGGEWEQADPNGTIQNAQLAAPDNDATPDGTLAFITENCEGAECIEARDTDVDLGPTHLTTPVLELAGSEATISYARWFFSAGGDQGGVHDQLVTEISNDGGKTWALVDSTIGTNSSWETVSFNVGEYVVPTDNVLVRFTANDTPNDSVTNAAIDDFVVEELFCMGPCTADLDGDSAVGVTDLLALLAVWGDCPGCPADLDGDGAVGVLDLLALLGDWGPCL